MDFGKLKTQVQTLEKECLVRESRLWSGVDGEPQKSCPAELRWLLAFCQAQFLPHALRKEVDVDSSA